MALTITIPGAVEATIGATAPAILTVGVGVPGATGATGAQGPQGDPGEGVPVGGSAGQVLAKIDGTNYNTEWVNVEGDYLPLAGGTMTGTLYVPTIGNILNTNLVIDAYNDDGAGTHNYFTFNPYGGGFQLPSGSAGITFGDATVQTTAWDPSTYAYRTLTDYDFTNVADTKLTTYGLTVLPNAPEDPNVFDSFVNATEVRQSYDSSEGGTVAGPQIYASYGYDGLTIKRQDWANPGEGFEPTLFYGSKLTGYGLSFVNFNGTTRASTVQYLSTGITFGNASVQTIAFPGFNNTALTGTPTAPTATFGDDDTSIATTAFVQAGLLGGTAIARNLEVQVRNQSGSTIPAGSIVYISGATGNLPLITLAQANNDTNSAQTMGFTAAAIVNNASGYVIVRGECQNLNTSALTEGTQLYLSPTVAGAYTTTKPAAPQHLVYVGIVIRAHPTLGTILVAVQNGYELNELHDVSLTTPANNDLLAYESSTDLWKNKTAATLGLAAINSQAFTGTPSLPTGTTGVTQTAGNNTTALATTAFVTTATPSASTTVSGLVELATDSEAQNGSSTTLGMTPSTVAYAKSSPSYFRMSALSSAGATSGTGSAASLLVSGFNSRSPTTAIGYGILSFGLYFHSRASGGQVAIPLPWNKRFVAQFRFAPRTLGTDANTINRVLFGKASGSTTGELTLRGVGVRQIASGALQLVVHNGTTFTAVTSSFTPTVAQSSTDLRIVSDGAGNVTLFNNDTQIATTSAGPSTAGTTANYFLTVESENLAIITGTNNTLYVAEISFEFAY